MNLPTILHAVLLILLLVICARPAAAADPKLPSPDTGSFLERRGNKESTVRIMSWNVWKGSIFPPKGIRHESFKRIVAAVQPDVVCLQEVGGPEVEENLPALMDALLPLDVGQKWQVHYSPDSDNVVISRYRLMQCSHEHVYPLPMIAPNFHLGYVACKVDLPDSKNLEDVYLVAAHFASGGNRGIPVRQKHADAIVRHLRRLRNGDEVASLPVATPTVILGDLNVFAQEPKDAAHHLTTLLTGNIVDEAEFGPDIDPDWDGSFLMEVKPRHNANGKEWYTWRSDGEPFPPGALDRIIFTDSVMKVEHSYVLNTTTMSQAELSRHGLVSTDVLKRSTAGDFDHLPLVVDFSFRSEAIAELRSSRQN
jgi:endonuclease/exonuclease/phosphatase family metal-dependent hydrolase